MLLMLGPTHFIIKLKPIGMIWEYNFFPHKSQSLHRRCSFDPWVGKIPWRRAWLPNPVFLPGESHGQRSLDSYSP